MHWNEQWLALFARIEGLMRAAEFAISSFSVSQADAFEVVEKSILPQFRSIIDELSQFNARYSVEFPGAAARALDKFIARMDGETSLQLGYQNVRGSNGPERIQILGLLAAFRSEFEYLIRDSEIEMRSLTELSFEHLRRTILVDPDVRKKWSDAFKAGEPKCEKLGAVHLLGHGIWAFKVVAAGGATDLVYQDSIDGHSKTIRRSARALVLTEWKRVTNPKAMEKKATEARRQTNSYSSGILGGTELKCTRYIVLVTKSSLPCPPDINEGGITYRHIVIPIDPESPSKEARRPPQKR